MSSTKDKLMKDLAAEDKVVFKKEKLGSRSRAGDIMGGAMDYSEERAAQPEDDMYDESNVATREEIQADIARGLGISTGDSDAKKALSGAEGVAKYIKSHGGHEPGSDYMATGGAEDWSQPMSVEEREVRAAARAARKTVITLPTYKKAVRGLLRDLMASEDLEDFCVSVEQLNAPIFAWELVKRAVIMATGGRKSFRETVSSLLAYGVGRIFSRKAVEQGFERALEQIEDIKLDVPDAEHVLGTFLARAVVDEVLPPAFLVNPVPVALSAPALDHARKLLSAEGAALSLEMAWGSGAARDVPSLKKQIRLAIEELFDSRDVTEAEKCLSDLKTPHFLHEAVKRAFVLSADKGEEEREAAMQLLCSLSKHGVLSYGQAKMGFERIAEALDDIRLDAPHAPVLFQRFVKRAREDDVIEKGTPAFAGEKPQGDGSGGAAASTGAATGGAAAGDGST